MINLKIANTNRLLIVLYCRYFLYTRTRFGRYYHGKDIAKAKEKYEDEGHTIIQPVDYESNYIDNMCPSFCPSWQGSRPSDGDVN